MIGLSKLPDISRYRLSFCAFFTTPRDAGGTGMELAIIRAVMESHGGTTTLAPDTSGVTFEL